MPNFSESSTNIYLKSGYLYASCKQINGQIKETNVNLNAHLGNSGGFIVPNSRGLFDEATEVNLQARSGLAILSCKLRDPDGDLVNGIFNLDEILSNDNGTLKYDNIPHYGTDKKTGFNKPMKIEDHNVPLEGDINPLSVVPISEQSEVRGIVFNATQDALVIKTLNELALFAARRQIEEMPAVDLSSLAQEYLQHMEHNYPKSLSSGKKLDLSSFRNDNFKVSQEGFGNSSSTIAKSFKDKKRRSTHHRHYY